MTTIKRNWRIIGILLIAALLLVPATQAGAVTIGYPNSDVGTQLGSSIFIVQEDTPDMMVNPGNTILVNFGTALFHDTPNFILGADLTLLVGTQLGFGLAQQAVDLGGDTDSFEVVASWSGNRGLVNAPGVDDFVIFEPGSLGGDEAYAVRVRRVDGIWTEYRYQFASDYIPDGVSNFFTRFDLSDFGICEGAFITAISVVSLTNTDTVDNISGEGVVTFGASPGGFMPLSAPAPLGTGAPFASGKFDADLAYIGALSAVLVVEVQVDIDIKPDSDPNCFNINGHGVIPVAINGCATFDVSQIDTSTLDFGGLSVRVKGNGNFQCAIEDWNDDGFNDLVCQFVDDGPLAWTPNNGTATLIGELLDGTPIEGTDSICIAPPE